MLDSVLKFFLSDAELADFKRNIHCNRTQYECNKFYNAYLRLYLKGLFVNPEKTEVLLFTRKRKTEGFVRLEYQGVKLNLTKEVKYLCVILDDKLTWKVHVRAQMKKGLRELWSCNAYIGRTWGLSPKMSLWLYKHVIIPKITYAAVAWWDSMDIALTRSELDCLQRAACIMIAGKMRTTPRKVLEMFFDLPTLGTAMESAALKATYRLP